MIISGFKPPGMVLLVLLDSYEVEISSSVTSLKSLKYSSGTVYSLTKTYKSRFRNRLIISRAFCNSGSFENSICFTIVSSSLINSFGSRMACDIRLFHPTSASTMASTIIYSTAFAFLCVYTTWCIFARISNNLYTLYTSLALKQISSSMTFMNEINRFMSTEADTPVFFESRIKYSNLSTSTLFLLFATMSNKNLFCLYPESFELIKSFTFWTILGDKSTPLSSTSHSNISHDMSS